MNRQTPASCTMSPACRMNTTRSLWRHEALGRPTLLWAMDGALFFRAVPPYGERPSPHQETEADTSARNTTRSHSNMLRRGTSRKFCRLTPPAFAGSSHRQTAGGGRSKSCPLSVVTNSVQFSRNRACQKACRHGAAASPDPEGHPASSSVLCHPSLKSEIMKMNFNVNYFFHPFRKFFEK